VIVVGDSSVFIALERIGRVNLLRSLYGEVHVPNAVWREIFVRPAQPAPPWMIRHRVAGHSLIAHLRERLDDGESEAIALACELKADLLLIDERLGRRAARQLGLAVRGLIGILIEARRHGHLTQLRPVLAELQAAGFWIADELAAEALREFAE
jgi:predicted nucleic acid-binding protein